jgi:hypothetical protein
MATDRDPLLEDLRQLPAIAPSAALDAEVRQAAHTALSDGKLSLFELIVYRGLVPTLLSGVTASYLIWAVRAASALY